MLPASKRQTILIIDDTITNLKVAVEYLQAYSFEILTATFRLVIVSSMMRIVCRLLAGSMAFPVSGGRWLVVGGRGSVVGGRGITVQRKDAKAQRTQRFAVIYSRHPTSNIRHPDSRFLNPES